MALALDATRGNGSTQAKPAIAPCGPPPAPKRPAAPAAPGDTTAEVRRHHQSHCEPQLLSFPSFGQQEEPIEGDPFEKAWTKYRDAEDEPTTATSADHLRERLGIDAEWRGVPQLKQLVESLKSNSLADPTNLTCLEKIAKRHGKGVAERVARVLNGYLAANPNPGREVLGVVQDALHDLAYPSDIAQLDKGTCTAAAVQIKAAIERPVQYAEMLTTLARNNLYKLPSGESLRPNQTWRGDKGDARSYSSKILQNSLMAFGKNWLIVPGSYDSSKEESGLGWSQQTWVLQQVFNDSNIDNDGYLTTASSLYDYMEDDIARGRTVSVSFDGHAALVVGIDKSKRGSTTVIIDSWGKQFAMSKDDFIKHVKAVRSVDDSGWDDWKVAAGSRKILGD